MNDRRNVRDADDFWDLSSLVPPRREKPPTSGAGRDTEAVEIVVSRESEQRGYRVEDLIRTERYAHPPVPEREKKQPPTLVYQPSKGLLHEVRIYPWRVQYDYYDTFRRHALAFLPKEGERVPFAEFFSYMPQYSQMNSAQLAYYFWWRTNFRRGEYLAADYAYLLLYLYELINVGDKLPPEVVRDAMLRLWLVYRDTHPRLDALVREWLCDYSLLFQLPAPALPPKLYGALLSSCRLREYYVPLEGQGDVTVRAMLLFCNNYDYTKSKFFTKESAADYHRVLGGAVGVALEYLKEKQGGALTGSSGVSTISRDTFTGAICCCRFKRHIEVDYTSFSHTHELRYIISDVLKYAENALRAARGIKSRLTVYAVDVTLRERLDAYLLRALPPKQARTRAKQEEIPLYERRYEIPAGVPSLARAAEIEEQSWQITKRLVEAFDDREQGKTTPDGVSFPKKEACKPPEQEVHEREREDTLGGALSAYRSFLALCEARDAGAQRQYARDNGRMMDAIVDEINTVAADMLGDIILEECEGGFVVIEEYRELLREEGVI